MAGQLCNYTKLGGQVGLDSKPLQIHGRAGANVPDKTDRTLDRQPSQQDCKDPKLQFIDSGLLTTLGGFSAISSPGDRTRFGHFLESFVFGELLKHATTADNDYHIFYYRDHDKVEVDYVVENTAGFLAGVEVKAAATVKDNDLKGIRRLAKAAGRKWICGIVLYDGNITLPLGKNIWAAPMSSCGGKHYNISGLCPCRYPGTSIGLQNTGIANMNIFLFLTIKLRGHYERIHYRNHL